MLSLLKRLVLVFVVAMLLFTTWFYQHINADIQLPVVPYEFSVESGSSLKNISKQLNDAGVLSNSWSFVLLSFLMGYESSIKAGDYKLTQLMSPVALLEYLVEGDIKQYEIKFIEGWTFSQIRQVLNQHAAIQHETVNLSEQEILHLIGATESKAEGLFFPDTYFFVKNSQDTEILRRAYLKMREHLSIAWSQRDASLPFTEPYEGLVLASIIEKETGLESDRAEISGVFINRLRMGMRLQTDPTVIYGMGASFDGNLRRKDLRTDHEHNTYTRAGLPPTPIAMPGLASIKAALSPADTKAIYFVAKGNGKSKFSTNLADHNRAVNKYQRQ